MRKYWRESFFKLAFPFSDDLSIKHTVCCMLNLFVLVFPFFFCRFVAVVFVCLFVCLFVSLIFAFLFICLLFLLCVFQRFTILFQKVSFDKKLLLAWFYVLLRHVIAVALNLTLKFQGYGLYKIKIRFKCHAQKTSRAFI